MRKNNSGGGRGETGREGRGEAATPLWTKESCLQGQCVGVHCSSESADDDDALEEL